MIGKEKTIPAIDEGVILVVKRGAAWLDENHVGWASRIDLSKLEMNACDRCVIGQAVGDYWSTINKESTSWAQGDISWPVDHGFDVPDDLDDTRSYYRALEILWTEQVKERLG